MEVKWFEGNISEAIANSRQRGAIFLVVVTGDDEASETMKQSLKDASVCSLLNSSDFVCIHLQSGSVECQQFGQFYPLAVVPCVYFIGLQGAPLEVAVGATSPTDLLARANKALFLHKGTPIAAPEAVAAVQSPEPAPPASSSPSSSVTPETSASSTPTVPLQDRVEHASHVLRELREKKEQEEREKEKAEEAERRRIGKELLKVKQAKQDKEIEELARERQKDKAEEKAARERVKQQIAQDRADRAARFQVEKQAEDDKRRVAQATKQAEEQSRLAAEAAIRSQFARLQFRLPDGSTRNEQFHAEQTLSDVRNYVRDSIRVPYKQFQFSTTFPRRDFTRNEESQTLRDLQLAPSAVLLIIPTSASAPAAQSVSLIWRILAPILYVWGWVRAALFNFAITAPPGPPNSTSPAAPATQNRTSPSSTQANKSSGNDAAKPAASGGSRFRQDGNIRRLVNPSDDDDENNTWNGNSTQQM